MRPLPSWWEPTPPPLTGPLPGDEPEPYDWAREHWWLRWVPLWAIAAAAGVTVGLLV